MALLQRRPIDTSAIVGRKPYEALYDTTNRLLVAGQTRFPYPGAVVRNAVTFKEIDAYQADPNYEGNQLDLAKASFLDPVNRAARVWWYSHPLNPHFKPTDLQFTHVNWSEGEPEKLDWHVDQGLVESTGQPIAGPVTAMAVMKGAIRYHFSATRKDPFNPADGAFFSPEPDFDGGRTATIDARVGDVVLITNVPAMFHAAEITGSSHRAIYFSGFEPVQPVE